MLTLEQARALRDGITPGPWEVWHGQMPDSEDDDPENFGVITQSGGFITWAFPTEMGAGGDTKANARLIAAAPDLLDLIEAQAAVIAALAAQVEALEVQPAPVAPEVAGLVVDRDHWKAIAEKTAAEAQKCFEAQREIDETWDAIGTRGNPNALSLSEQVASIIRELDAALDASPAPEVAGLRHRSFPDAADARPMPPGGDELMIAGLGGEDARFIAIQLMEHGITLTDWRAEAVKELTLAHRSYMIGKGRDPEKYASQFSMAVAALAALEARHE